MKNTTKKAATRIYALRTCDANLKSYGGFQWPASGRVETSDWRDDDKCGHGLHGLLAGEGDGSLVSWEPGAVWLIVDITEAHSAGLVRELKGKVKFPYCDIVHKGDQQSATQFLVEAGVTGAIVGAFISAGYAGTATAGDSGTATAGVRGTATAGDSGTATAGVRGTATAGYAGTATAGDAGTATAGDVGTATAGYAGTATAGDSGTATAGDWGTATAGDWGTATAGDWGTATAGVRGTATAGDRGTATAGDSGTATAGDLGTVQVRWWDAGRQRYRTCTGYVGEDGIEANVAYLVEDGKLIKA